MQEIDRVIDLYRLSIDTRNFEISQLGYRNNFFMIFQGVLLAGITQASQAEPLAVVSFFVCLIGVIIGILQTAMAAGAKFWQERWEAEAIEKEERLLELIYGPNESAEDKFWRLFSLSVEDSKSKVYLAQKGKFLGFLVRRKFSVSQIPIFVGISFTLIWSALCLCTIQTPMDLSTPAFISGFSN